MQKPRRSSLTGEVDTRPVHEHQRERDLGQRDLNCRYKAMAALTAFASLGFRKTSMALLAECIGTSRQTLYNRFAGKSTYSSGLCRRSLSPCAMRQLLY
ncbi:MAG: hypothetical protein CMD51_05975 [Gammaproteobacteria bacterium]|nr:hypothetical protein [Gammaproteobacteria bacterium]